LKIRRDERMKNIKYTCRYEKIPYKYCPNCGALMEDKPCG